ncbi:hypothetical protein J7T55_007621 [Diaporthe amygdali]|uniref:uncharacterized protein n=1 Tax=Phomopsis amygdali TaxID=1214568 RepID=UPI0022FEB7C3|nr:uncharacterized protein J7T55_007621 [Diaporthe amygdali]KAJ0107251.1 hypothetical protein J7T55_007621 [Diaporthe amygdali]
MRTTFLLSFLSALALPALARPEPPTRVLAARQSVVTPPPCKAISPPPTAAETEERFNKFANEFLVTKNLTAAFEFISSTYINHNPFADDGPNAALDFLGPVWPGTQITVLRTRYIDPQGFLNYEASGIGTVVDRFRWEAGCIVEHWDQGEVFPADNSSTTSTSSMSANVTTTPLTPVTSGASRRYSLLGRR